MRQRIALQNLRRRQHMVPSRRFQEPPFPPLPFAPPPPRGPLFVVGGRSDWLPFGGGGGGIDPNYVQGPFGSAGARGGMPGGFLGGGGPGLGGVRGPFDRRGRGRRDWRLD